MSKIPKKDQPSPIEQALELLIPADAVSEQVNSIISADFLQHRYETAMGIKSNDPTLTTSELTRFNENCELIGLIEIGNELRNYLLWEVFSTGQFRQTDQDFESFGARVAKLSKPQLRKCADAGRIRIAMIHAGLDDVRPTGRQVEALAKIKDVQHTVPAWQYALGYMRENGRSDAKASEGLAEYCKIKKIPFGRRMPNGSRKLPIQKVLAAKKPANDPDTNDKSAEEWCLSPHEQQLIIALDPKADLKDNGPRLQQSVAFHIEALRKLAATDDQTDYETRQVEELLALVMRKDEQMARSLAKLALKGLRGLILVEIRNGEGNPKPQKS